MITSVTNSGKQYLKGKESLRLKAYKLRGESGYTIGYGNKFYENGNSVKSTDTITATRAAQLFENIVAQFAKNVRAIITANVNQNQFDALVIYAYNRGIGAFKKTSLVVMVNRNPNDPAIIKQFEIEWGSNTEYKAALIKRRQEEAAIYASGGSITPFAIVPFALLAYTIYKVIK